MEEKYKELKELVTKLSCLEKKYDKKINPNAFKKMNLKILNMARDILISEVVFGYEQSLPSPYCEKAAEEIKEVLKEKAIPECKPMLLVKKDMESFCDLVKKYKKQCDGIMGMYLKKYFSECPPKYFSTVSLDL